MFVSYIIPYFIFYTYKISCNFSIYKVAATIATTFVLVAVS